MKSKVLSVVCALMISMTAMNTAGASEYVCEQTYNKKVEKYERSFTRRAGRVALPTAGVAGAWSLMVAELGVYGAYMVTIWSPGLAILALGASAGTGIYNLLDKPARIIQAKAILDMSKKSVQELENENFEARLDERVSYMNHQRRSVGLPTLTQEEIDVIAGSLQTGLRDKNIFDEFVRKVSKKGKNKKFTYEQVRKKFIELASETNVFCPENKKGEAKPVTYKKLIKLTKEALVKN